MPLSTEHTVSLVSSFPVLTKPTIVPFHATHKLKMVISLGRVLDSTRREDRAKKERPEAEVVAGK